MRDDATDPARPLTPVPAVPADDGSTSDPGTAEVVDALLDALLTGDRAALVDVLTDDVAYRPVGPPSGVVRGVAAVLEAVLVAPPPGVEDGHVEVVEVHLGGRGRAVVVLRTAARVDGVARAVETVLHVVVADGRVAGLTEYVDDPAAAVALGVQRG